MDSPTTTVRAIAYHRVSTDEQAATGNGLDAQAATVIRAVEARGWSLVATLTDEGRSGGNLRRPALLDALDRLDRGEADALVVAKLDRLSRSVLDFAAITEQAKRRGWSVVALDVDVDTTTPTGELVANITSSVAQWERRIIGARTSEAMQAMKRRGVRLGRPVELPDVVRDRIAAARDAGATLRAIADAFNAEAVPTARGGRWHASTVAAVLGSLTLDTEAAVLAVTA
jgi:DNA invertase Pin-like site-specific DNA recombinase